MPNPSQSKGKRGEYLLRDHLRELGYTADRVPCSGAAQGAMFKGDVRASKDGKSLLFEVKLRANSFGPLYGELAAQKTDLIATNMANPGLMAAISTSLVRVLDPGIFLFAEKVSPFSRKLLAAQKFLGPCDILVLKDDRKPFLFVRYF